ncbi:MAG: carbohydrate-binding domain-containing protein [Thermoplasmata archaeon]|nr:carbohydrate-binding domain-containing protein [Thermoplasmata archaeon]
MKNAMAIFAVAVMLAVVLAPASLAEAADDEVGIVLSDSGVTVDGATASTDSSSAVYVGAEIVYYESGTDSSYGEGTEADMHDASEAALHTVVTITAAGTYRISGTLSYGQIAVDVGTDETDVVTLILDGVDITCTVAPAIIFYSVWESGDASTATTDIPDEAGANIVIADDSVNNVSGSYVARIYKEGTTSKLHKYDGAVYSKMSMIVSGGTKGNGVLNITAENEGLDSELHLTINGGIITIAAQNDGINTNEDYISVTEINGGTLYVVGGLGDEGDGIDSNGYIVINGGTVYATAKTDLGDGGIDADMDIIINGGTVVAIGGRNDSVSTSSTQAYMELSYASIQAAGTMVCLTDASGNVVIAFAADRTYQSVTISTADLNLGTTYHLYSGGTCTGTLAYGIYSGGSYSGGTQMQYTGNSSAMGGGSAFPGMDGSMMPGGTTVPGGTTAPTTPGSTTTPDQTTVPTAPDGTTTVPGSTTTTSSTGSVEFTLTESVKTFSGVSATSTTSKTSVTIDVEYSTDDGITVTSITVTAGSTALDISDILQVTVQDDPAESYYATASAGDLDAVNAIMPTDAGTYTITVAVSDSDDSYTGVYQATITIAEDGTVTVGDEYSTDSTDPVETTSGDSGSGSDSDLLTYVAVAVVAAALAAVVTYAIVRRRP